MVIGQLDFQLVGQSGGHKVFGHYIARRIRSRAADASSGLSPENALRRALHILHMLIDDDFFLPVSPESPCGPPATNLPVGFIRNLVLLSISLAVSLPGYTWLITSCSIPLGGTPSSCCVEITTVSTLTDLVPSYSTVTWDLPSRASGGSIVLVPADFGKSPRKPCAPARRASASVQKSRCTRTRTSCPGHRRLWPRSAIRPTLPSFASRGFVDASRAISLGTVRRWKQVSHMYCRQIQGMNHRIPI